MSVLLDTHALIWLMHGVKLDRGAKVVIDRRAAETAVYLSVVSAWEIGLLAARGRVSLEPDPKAWFAVAARKPGVRLLGLEPECAIESAFLPEPFHSDPADRLLVASARHHDLTLVTRDRRILAYAEAGHLRAMAC